MRPSFGFRLRRCSAGLLAALLGAAPVAVSPFAAHGARLPLERVSVNSTGAERDRVPSGSTTGCAMREIEDPGAERCGKRTISDDGTKVVFLSAAPNLVDGDTNGVADVFLADLTTSPPTVSRMSVSDSGAQADDASASPSISPNGRYVAFESAARNLVTSDDIAGFTNVFVRDVVANRTHLASVPTNPNLPGDSFHPQVANDGSVAFTSTANNLTTPDEISPFQKVFVRRQATSSGAATVLVSRAAGDIKIPNGPSLEPSISADGTRVAFTGRGTNYTGDPDPAGPDVFVATLSGSGAGTTVAIRKVTGTTTTAGAHSPSISPDGRQVAFVSDERLTGDVSGSTRKDVFVVSSDGGSPQLMSRCSCSDADDRPAVRPSVANVGAPHTVVFESLALFAGAPRQNHVWAGTGSRISRVSADAGDAPGTGASRAASISGDGTKVVFTSAADNLVPGDRNGVPDVFVKDLGSGAVTRVSVGPGNREASGFSALPGSAPAVGGDGSIVVFESDSTNLVPGDANGVTDIFGRHRVTGVTERISKGFDGGAPNGPSGRPSISADGNLVAFESAATNLVPGDTNERTDIFVHDRRSGQTRRVSLVSADAPGGGSEAADGASRNPSISPNGRYVAFESTATLAGEPARSSWKIYRADLTTGHVVLISRHATRLVALAQGSFNPSVADNGSVAFESKARNLTDPPEPAIDGVRNWQDIYVADPSGRVTKASLTGQGADADGGDSYDAALSADGRRVAFTSEATNLVAGDTNLAADVFVRDLGAGTTTLVSAGSDGRPARGGSHSPAVNGDGSVVAFVSDADNIVPGDSNFAADVFISINGGRARMSADPITGAAANGPSFTPAVSFDGLTVAFHSLASNLVAGDTNGVFDTFVRDMRELPALPCPPHCPTTPGGQLGAGVHGYWFVASDGGIFAFGTSAFHGSMGDQPLNRPIVGMAATPSRGGYWLVASDGGIFAFGDAGFFGSTGDISLNQPIVGMAPSPTGGGYWFVASDGGVFSFGDADFFGSMGGQPLNRPIVGMAPSPTGDGYWLVASDGGIFAFGDAGFFGSTGDISLNQPIVGMAPTATGGGYWFVASDGGIFAFGDAGFFGSMGGQPLNRPIVGLARAPRGDGYWLVASDGGIFAFGVAAFEGSTGDISLNRPIVSMAS